MAITIQTKTGGPAEVEPSGDFKATIARLDLGPDHEGDVYVGPQAFPVGKTVLVSTWMHGSWGAGQLPVGTAKIYANASHATAVGKLFLDTAGGRETFATLKAMKQAGIPSEFSYGYEVKEASYDDLPPGGKRRLDSLDIHEISPVLKGAGIGTALEDIKADEAAAERAWRDHLELLWRLSKSADPMLALQAIRMLVKTGGE